MKLLSDQSVAAAAVREVRRQPRHSSTAFKRIVAPTDLSDHARKGVMYAARLARYFGAELYLLHVYQEPPCGGFSRGLYDCANRQNHRQLVEEEFLALREEIRVQHPRCTALLGYEGAPAREIVAAARELSADLIVISTHHRTCFERLVFGNDSEIIARKAGCPVLVVGEDKRDFVSLRRHA
jgi:universal stress protein A